MSEKPEQRTCIACGESAAFTFNLVGYMLRMTPKVSKSSSAVGVCGECCNPKNAARYEKFKRDFAVIVFMLCNDLHAVARESGAVTVQDRKSAAAGGE